MADSGEPLTKKLKVEDAAPAAEKEPERDGMAADGEQERDGMAADSRKEDGMAADSKKEDGMAPDSKKEDGMAAEGEKEDGMDIDGEGISHVTFFERQPEQVGMTEFLGLQKGFSGVVKSRWEDFHVHEIDLQGNVVRLTSLDPPEPTDAMTSSRKTTDDFSLPEDIQKGLSEVVSGERLSFSFPAPDDKAERKNFHCAMKIAFPGLNSNTKNIDGNRVIEATLLKNNKGPQRRDGRGPFTCRFVLHKKGRDTAAAVSVLGALLKCRPQNISYSGNKDRRGVTSQLLAAYQVTPAQLLALNPKLRGMMVGNCSYVKKSLRLGDLTGNRFTIAIREVEGEDADIEESVQSLKEHGFINYFGLQRFGSSPVASYEVGLTIFMGQWEKAIDILMEPQPTDLPIVRQLKQKFLDGAEPASCLEGMSDHVARNLLQGITRFGKTLKALQNMPRQTLLLYVHSVQSLLWNKLVSRRIREGGLQVRPGDLFFRKDCLENRVKTKNAVAQVTEANKSDVSIYDIIMPLPGYDVTFGNGVTKDWYHELLAEMNLSESMFKSEVRDFQVTGTYRPIFVRPGDLTHFSTRYTDPEQALIASDQDILTGQPAVCRLTEGKFRAVVVSFSLPKSSYGTVAMREMMRDVRIKK